MLFAILEISSVLVESLLFLFEKGGRAQRGGEEMFVLQYLRNKCHSTRRLDRTTFGPCRWSVVGGRWSEALPRNAPWIFYPGTTNY
jgi:hypothetical protein